MSTFDQRVPRPGTQKLKAVAGRAALALGACAMVAATPVGFSSVDGDLVLTWQVAAAQGKGNGGGNGNGNGNGGGNGGGGGSSTGGGSSGGGTSGGSGSGANSAGPGGASERGESGDRSFGPELIPGAGIIVAQFTTRISLRKPANRVSEIRDPHQAVSFFTQFAGMQGQSVTHRWIHNGVIEYQASFKINGPNWRVWSTQLLPVDKPGDWRVEVVDESNKVLETGRLDFQPTG